MSIYAGLLLISVLIGGLLTGCDAASPPVSPEIHASATPARGLTEPVGSDEQLSLDDRLTCQEAELFEQPPRVQAAWLAHGSVLSCEVEPATAAPPLESGAGTGIGDGGPLRQAATCTGTGGLRLFGLPVMAVRVAASAEPAQGLQIDLQAGAAELATAASEALGVQLVAQQPDPASGDGPGYRATDEDGRVYYVSGRPADPGLLDPAQAGASQTDPPPAEMATFGCLAPGSASAIQGS